MWRRRWRVGGVDLQLTRAASGPQRRLLHAGLSQSLDHPADRIRRRPARSSREPRDLRQSTDGRTRSATPVAAGASAPPHVDPEAHVPALVPRDELQDPSQQGIGRLAPDALEDAHREALEEELLRRDELQRVVRRQERVEHHLGACVDVLDVLPHGVDEPAIGEMVPRLVHRLRRRVIAVVLLAEREHQPGTHVLRHALADLQDVQHAAERTARRVGLHALGKRLERRRLSVRGPGMGHSGSSASTGTLQSTSCSKSQSAECALAKSALMPGWPVLWSFRSSRVLIGSLAVPTDTPRAVAMPPGPAATGAGRSRPAGRCRATPRARPGSGTSRRPGVSRAPPPARPR